MTDSMRRAIDETERRRTVQDTYNQQHGIVPATIVKQIRDLTDRVKMMVAEEEGKPVEEMEKADFRELSKTELSKLVKQLEAEMKKAAQGLEFEKAAALRDQLFEIRGALAEQEMDRELMGK
jgi:excinuclease ABC subunit B